MKKWISILLALVLLVSCAAAAAAEEWAEYCCGEERFTIQKPLHTNTEYKNERGMVGQRIYLGVPGYPPFVLVHRRALARGLKNPENYLNNTYREFLEKKNSDSSVMTSKAKIWEAGGKQLTGAKYVIRSGGTEITQIQLVEKRLLGDVEYTAMYSTAEEEAKVMEALNAAAESYLELGVERIDPKALTEDQELRLLTVNLDYHDYVLGKSTPQDMADNGWIVNDEGDGTFTLCQEWIDGQVFVATEHGAMDEPVTVINAFWSDGCPIEYFGFDGCVNPGLMDDPDQAWNTSYEYEELMNLVFEEDFINANMWDGMVTWMTSALGAEVSEEGIYEVRIPLRNGQILSISSHDSPVSLAFISP